MKIYKNDDGLKFVKTGAHRLPKKGEWFLSKRGNVILAIVTYRGCPKCHILRKIEQIDCRYISSLIGDCGGIVCNMGECNNPHTCKHFKLIESEKVVERCVRTNAEMPNCRRCDGLDTGCVLYNPGKGKIKMKFIKPELLKATISREYVEKNACNDPQWLQIFDEMLHNQRRLLNDADIFEIPVHEIIGKLHAVAAYELEVAVQWLAKNGAIKAMKTTSGTGGWKTEIWQLTGKSLTIPVPKIKVCGDNIGAKYKYSGPLKHLRNRTLTLTFIEGHTYSLIDDNRTWCIDGAAMWSDEELQSILNNGNWKRCDDDE